MDNVLLRGLVLRSLFAFTLSCGVMMTGCNWSNSRTETMISSFNSITKKHFLSLWLAPQRASIGTHPPIRRPLSSKPTSWMVLPYLTWIFWLRIGSAWVNLGTFWGGLQIHISSSRQCGMDRRKETWSQGFRRIRQEASWVILRLGRGSFSHS